MEVKNITLLHWLLGRQISSEQLIEQCVEHADWYVSVIKDHRLGSALYLQAIQLGIIDILPEGIRKVCQLHYKQAAYRALLIQGELQSITKTLKSLDVEPIFMKGSSLSLLDYPQVSMRSMRDIDFLVSPLRALDVYELMLSMGYRQLKSNDTCLQTTLKVAKHLPPLVSPSSGLIIEVHFRVIDSISSNCEWDLFDESQFSFALRSKKVAGTMVLFESKTDLLFHIIVHAAYDSRFSNGPVTLLDIKYLLEDGGIDWDYFWDLAEKSKRRNGCALVIALYNKAAGGDYILTPRVNVRDVLSEHAFTLMFFNVLQARDVSDLTKVKGKGCYASLKSAVSIVFPSRQELDFRWGGFPPLIRPMKQYLKHWGWLCKSKLPLLLRNLRASPLDQGINSRRAVDFFLEEPFQKRFSDEGAL